MITFLILTFEIFFFFLTFGNFMLSCDFYGMIALRYYFSVKVLVAQWLGNNYDALSFVVSHYVS